MGAIALAAGTPAALSVQGRTLSIVNDPTIAMEASYGIGPLVAWGAGVAEQWLPNRLTNIEAGVVLVGFNTPPASSASADAAAPPFANTTIPIPKGVDTVYLLYPAANPANEPNPRFRVAQANITNPRISSDKVTVWVGWSDAEGPLQVTPTGSILPARIFDQEHSIAVLPVDTNLTMIPPSPATTVYDQDVGFNRGGPFFRPHLAPSMVSTARVSPPLGITVYPLVLSGYPDPFNPPAGSRAVARAIFQVIVTVNGVTGAHDFVIGTSSLAFAQPDSSEFIRLMITPGGGPYVVDFGEGIAPNFRESGQYKYWAGMAGVIYNIMVIHG